MLLLFPVQPQGAGPCEPLVDGEAQLGLAMEPGGERNVVEVDVVPVAELAEVAKQPQLALPVEAVALVGAVWNDEVDTFEIAQHPGRPPGLLGRLADCHPIHGRYLNTDVSRSAAAVEDTRVLRDVERSILRHVGLHSLPQGFHLARKDQTGLDVRHERLRLGDRQRVLVQVCRHFVEDRFELSAAGLEAECLDEPAVGPPVR